MKILQRLEAIAINHRAVIESNKNDKCKFIWGSLSEEDLKDNVLDFFKCIKREAYEEIGLELTDNVNISPKYFITRVNLLFINTLYIVAIDLSSEDVKTLFLCFDWRVRGKRHY